MSNPAGRPLRARYIGYTQGTENHGDESLIELIRDLLAPEIEVVVEEGAADIALLGGGTLINQSPWLIDEFERALNQANAGIVVGTGVGDTYFWGDHFKRWNALLERCSHVGVRGPDSLQLLQNHGYNRALCVGDPYLSLRAPCEPNPIAQRLGVNLGTANGSIWGSDEPGFLEFMANILAQLCKSGWSFSWISVWSKDLPIMQAIREKVAPDSRPVIDARAQTQEAYAALAQCELFMGEKLHANAMAAVAGVPFVALEYQPKVMDFAASLGMEKWVISTAKRKQELIIDRLQRLRQARAEYFGVMIGHREELRRILGEFVNSIKQHYIRTHLKNV